MVLVFFTCRSIIASRVYGPIQAFTADKLSLVLYTLSMPLRARLRAYVRARLKARCGVLECALESTSVDDLFRQKHSTVGSFGQTEALCHGKLWAGGTSSFVVDVANPLDRV